jgi:predicted aspartyl protease
MGWNDIVMGSAFPRWSVPLLAAAVTAAPPSLARIAAAGGHPGAVPLRASAEIERDGVRYRITDERAGRTRLVRACAEELCTGTWFDGDRLFTLGINGDRFPASERETRAERTLDAVLSLRFADPGFTGTVAAGAAGEYAVRASGGSELAVAIDPRTALPTAVRAPDGSYVQAFAPPQWFAGAVTLGEMPFERIERAGAERLLPVEPAVTIGAAVAPVPAAGARVPAIPCTLETLPLRCLLDTGSTPSSVTLAVAERLGREPHGRLVVRSLESVSSGTIDAGELRFANVTVGTLHYGVIASTRDRGYDVVVGSDILGGLRFEIASATHAIRFTASGARPRGVVIPLEFEAGSPYVRIEIDGAAEPALVDTGDEALVAIGYDAYRRGTRFAVRPAGTVAGAVGSSDTLEGIAGDGRIGPLELGKMPVVVVRSEHGAHVGMGLSERCAVLGVDLHAAELDCVPR